MLFKKLFHRRSKNTNAYASISYMPSNRCVYRREPGEDVCLKCGRCGRKFKNGFLPKRYHDSSY